MTGELLEQAHKSGSTTERDYLHDQVVILNLRVAHAVANRYRGRGVAVEDLQQAAAEGLAKAVARYDITRHHDLLSFAVPTMRGEVLRYFRDHAWSVRPPRRVQELQWQISRATESLSASLGRQPTEVEVCEAMEIEAKAYEEAVVAFGCLSPPSLDQPVGGSEEITLGSGIADESTDDQVAEARALLTPLLSKLSEREQRVLYLRFFQDRTQREIGEEFGVPQMQVSRWLTSIFAKLRDEIGSLEAA